MHLANLIFPAPALVFALGLFMPFAIVAALAVEWLVFETREGHNHGFRRLLMILHLNFWSTFAGLFITTRFPSGVEMATGPPSLRDQLTRSPEYGTLAVAGVVIAYGLSVAIEYAALRVFYRDERWTSPFTTVLIANSLSYPVFIGLAVFFG